MKNNSGLCRDQIYGCRGYSPKASLAIKIPPVNGNKRNILGLLKKKIPCKFIRRRQKSLYCGHKKNSRAAINLVIGSSENLF